MFINGLIESIFYYKSSSEAIPGSMLRGKAIDSVSKGSCPRGHVTVYKEMRLGYLYPHSDSQCSVVTAKEVKSAIRDCCKDRPDMPVRQKSCIFSVHRNCI